MHRGLLPQKETLLSIQQRLPLGQPPRVRHPLIPFPFFDSSASDFLLFFPIRMKDAVVPEVGDQNVSECKKIVKRCSSGCRPLSMTRVETEVFILCYDSEHHTIHFIPRYFFQTLTYMNGKTEFGVYVNRHGIPLLDRGITEWECQADRASFRFPYVLLFSSAFIEIRNLLTGQLTQIIRPDAAIGVSDVNGTGGGGDPGEGPRTLRCLWEGRGGAQTLNNCDPDFDGGSGPSAVELPTVLGAVDLALPNDEWGAQSSSVVTQQCVFTLFAPVPPPYSPVEEPAVPYDAGSII